MMEEAVQIVNLHSRDGDQRMSSEIFRGHVSDRVGSVSTDIIW